MSDLDPEGMQDKCNKGKNILHVRDYVSCFTDEHNTYVGCFTWRTLIVFSTVICMLVSAITACMSLDIYKTVLVGKVSIEQ